MHTISVNSYPSDSFRQTSQAVCPAYPRSHPFPPLSNTPPQSSITQTQPSSSAHKQKKRNSYEVGRASSKRTPKDHQPIKWRELCVPSRAPPQASLLHPSWCIPSHTSCIKSGSIPLSRWSYHPRPACIVVRTYLIVQISKTLSHSDDPSCQRRISRVMEVSYKKAVAFASPF